METTSFNMLHPLVRKWIWNQGWTSLKEIQVKSIPVILKGGTDVIIGAPTAEGKTEAAFLPIISSILSSKECGAKVLYLSPLKALINDQYLRLTSMTQQMPIAITPWHGDISVAVKKKFISNPSGVLVITPESLESLLINKQQDTFNVFRNLEYVVIDELHSLLGTERGIQVLSLLTRLEAVIKKDVPRISMSATFSNYSDVISYLGTGHTMPCTVIEDKKATHDVKILLKNIIGSKGEYEIVSDLYKHLRGSNNLVFTNSRTDAEMCIKELSAMSENNFVPNEFRLHHANVSREQKYRIEQSMKRGDKPLTTICTSTLELGIDIGKVKSVAQIGNINSVASFRQRLGRSGRRNEPSVIRIYTKESKRAFENLHLNLVQNISAVELMLQNKFESVVDCSYHFSTLIQQILSLLAAFGSFYPNEAWELLCNKGAFTNVSRDIFFTLLKDLENQNVINQRTSGEFIIGIMGEKILQEKDFYTAFYSAEEYCVINIADGCEIGTIQEELQIEDIVNLNACSWIVIKTDRKSRRIYVKETSKKGRFAFDCSISFVEKTIVENMKQVLLSANSYLYLDKRSNAVKALAEARGTFAEMKLNTNAFIKHDKYNYWFTWAGSKINNALYLMANTILQHDVSANHIYIKGISVDDILTIYRNGIPNAISLVSTLERKNKEQQKYDYLLPDNLLDMEYAKTYIDLEGAWILIRKTIEKNN